MSIQYRKSHAPSGLDVFYEKIAPIITGLGAAVVIVGALFKIQHWPGGSLIITIGLLTEAVLFAMFAFAPPPSDPDWTLLYPELGVDEHGDDEGGEDHIPLTEQATPKNLTGKMNEMLDKAGLTQDTIDKMTAGFNSLSENVGKMNVLTDASVATDDYVNNIKTASSSINEMNGAYAQTVEAMKSMANASTDAQEYHNQVQNITKNLGSLNAVYEMELQDANNHLKAMNKFYGNLSQAMEAMADASKDTETFRSELSKLTNNLTSLNTVYGSMLAAMKG